MPADGALHAETTGGYNEAKKRGAGFCDGVYQVSRGVGEGVFADREGAVLGRDAVGELAEEEFWRGYGCGRECGARDRTRRGARGCEGMRGN